MDEIVPFFHAEDLYAVIPHIYRVKPLWLQGYGHNDIGTWLGCMGIYVYGS